MRIRSIDNVIFIGMVLILIYQNTLLYLSVVSGSWINFLIISLVFIFAIFLDRSTYLILNSVISFVAMCAGGLMLLLPYTRAMFFWSAIALLTVSPLTTYCMYLLYHQLLKLRALSQELEQLQENKPDLEVVTGALNERALNIAVGRELKLVYYHEDDYRFTLTMVKIDFLESVINFLGNQEFNNLLRTTAEHLMSILFTVDTLYYIGTGRFVILSPMLGSDNSPIMKRKIKSHINDIAEKFGLARNALVLRMGQITYSSQDKVKNRNVEDTLKQLERSAETDIVKEYL